MNASICHTCAHGKEIVSGKGSRFLLCQLSLQNGRYPKYPPQPVINCSGYAARSDRKSNMDTLGDPDLG